MWTLPRCGRTRSEEHTSELQSLRHLVCRLLLEKKSHIVRAARIQRVVRCLVGAGHATRVPPRVCVGCLSRLRLSLLQLVLRSAFFFFFNDTATTEIYTLSLHDALPI